MERRWLNKIVLNSTDSQYYGIHRLRGKDMIKGLPDFLVVGAAKSGTTSLYYYLKKHPSIYLSDTKEVWFFSFKDNPPHDAGPASLGKTVVTNLEEYKRLFLDAQRNQLCGDICPSYLYTHLVTVDNIKEAYGREYKKLKIIISLRNPVDRAYSQYMMFKRDDCEPLSFEEAIKPDIIHKRLHDGWNIFYDYISLGMYYEQVNTFLRQFPETKVILFDDFIRSPKVILAGLMEFLGIEKTHFHKGVDFRYNVSGIPKYKKLDNFVSKRNLLKSLLSPGMKKVMSKDARYKLKSRIRNTYMVKPSMRAETRNRLISIYEQDILRLQALLNRNLGNWITKENRCIN